MPELTCPVCHETAEPLVRLRDLAICGACGASLFVGDGVRPAKFSDTETLSMAEKATLKTQHAKLWRPEKQR